MLGGASVIIWLWIRQNCTICLPIKNSKSSSNYGTTLPTLYEPIVLLDSVISEIERRCAEYEADPSIAIDEDEMWRRVNEK